MKVLSAGRQLSLSHARNLSVCADLQHVDDLVQSKQFAQIKPLRVAFLPQDCMNIDMQLINRSGWSRGGMGEWARGGQEWQSCAGARLVDQEEVSGDSGGEELHPLK